MGGTQTVRAFVAPRLKTSSGLKIGTKDLATRLVDYVDMNMTGHMHVRLKAP